MILQGLEESDSNAHAISILDLMFSGSASGLLIIVFLILLLSVAIYIYVERTLFLKNVKKINREVLDIIDVYFLDKDYDAVIKVCDESDAPISKIIKKLFLNKDYSYDHIVKSIEDTVSVQTYVLERNINFLATIAGAGPMIGFLGTVIGMILSFYDISVSGGQSDMGIIASGIYTAMTTTVAGLVVGISTNLGYNHMVMKTEALLHDMQLVVTNFLDSFFQE